MIDGGERPPERRTPYGVSVDPGDASILVRSFWQVVTYLLGASLVATWIWVWNTQGEIGTLHAVAERLPELVEKANLNRAIIEVNSGHILKLEEMAARGMEDRKDLREQDHDLREAMRNLNDALQALQLDHARLTETVRSLVNPAAAELPQGTRFGDATDRPGRRR